MGNNRRRKLSLIVIALFIFLPWAWAGVQKIAIEAERLEHSLSAKITHCYGTEKEPVRVTYGTWELKGQYARWEEDAGVLFVKGKVEVVQKGAENLKLQCQQLHFWPQKEELEATGSVVMERGELKATASKATGAQEQVVLTGEPIITRGEDIIRGKKITVLFSPQERIVVEGARVEVEAPQS